MLIIFGKDLNKKRGPAGMLKLPTLTVGLNITGIKVVTESPNKQNRFSLYLGEFFSKPYQEHCLSTVACGGAKWSTRGTWHDTIR
jgi:hypothetical protein